MLKLSFLSVTNSSIALVSFCREEDKCLLYFFSRAQQASDFCNKALKRLFFIHKYKSVIHTSRLYTSGIIRKSAFFSHLFGGLDRTASCSHVKSVTNGFTCCMFLFWGHPFFLFVFLWCCYSASTKEATNGCSIRPYSLCWLSVIFLGSKHIFPF